MKIIAFLDTFITNGGGFNQALNAILQMKRICEDRFEFSVVTISRENMLLLKTNGITAILFKESVRERLFSKLISFSFFRKILDRIDPQWLCPIEKRLKELKADLVYFVTPSSYALTLRSLNFIFTVWDNCYRDNPEFPEIKQFGQFQIREALYRGVLSPAFLVFTDSSLLADNIARRYGIDRDRLLPIPFAPSPTLSMKSSLSLNATLEKYKLEKGYFFYPAQFWPHKNHVRILVALLILRKERLNPMIVFAGGDQGNLRIIELFIQQNNLQNQVRLLGFVPSDDMPGLYQGCRAVLMPTYFGPTNIPPLEAWMIGKPLIYSTQLKEQAHDAALLIDPDEADDIASAMRSCFDESVCRELVRLGHERLLEIQKEREQAESELLEKLIQFEKRLSCWKPVI